ncbi:MAG: hypothetical protein K0S81_2869 [Rhodospirillales bacterium]|nr:hypothetical protein [Rhodospirillales bacterium]
MAKGKGQRKGKKLVGAVLLSASVVGTTIALPERVEAQSAPVQVAQAAGDGIPYLGQGNKTGDDHRNESRDGFDY